MTLRPDQFYTGLVADAYAPLRQSAVSPDPYERFVRRFGQPALELGCGDGEPLLDLIAAGLDVTGLDSSADMLERCRRAATERHLEVELVCQRMEQLDLGTTFATIYLAGPTFQLVVDLDDVRAAMGRIAAHLRPGGRVLIPLFIPKPVATAALGVWRSTTVDEGDELAFRVVSEDFRRNERRVDTTLQYRRGPHSSPLELVERVWSLRWYEPNEFEELLGQAGLRMVSERSDGSGGRSLIVGRT